MIKMPLVGNFLVKYKKIIDEYEKEIDVKNIKKSI